MDGSRDPLTSDDEAWPRCGSPEPEPDGIGATDCCGRCHDDEAYPAAVVALAVALGQVIACGDEVPAEQVLPCRHQLEDAAEMADRLAASGFLIGRDPDLA